MRLLSDHKETIETWRNLDNRVNNLLEMIDLLEEEKDEELESEVKNEISTLSSELNNLEIKLILDDDYDDRDAILAIHAGAGGTESQDWAEMLLRMYLRWAEKHRYKVEILDTTPGDEAGIKSTTLEIRGRFAYGYLRSERGVHRLVRLSPFDADHARHTSFALVEVLPQVKELTEININNEDLKIDTFRSKQCSTYNSFTHGTNSQLSESEVTATKQRGCHANSGSQTAGA
jgi:peptide chain release factor 2